MRTKEQIATYNKEYRLKNKEKLNAMNRAYRKKYPDRYKAYDKKKYIKNMPKILLSRKVYAKKYAKQIKIRQHNKYMHLRDTQKYQENKRQNYLKNKERYDKYHREYYHKKIKNNPLKIEKDKIRYTTRRKYGFGKLPKGFEYHHPDYTKPWMFQILKSKTHKKIHRKYK